MTQLKPLFIELERQAVCTACGKAIPIDKVSVHLKVCKKIRAIQ